MATKITIPVFEEVDLFDIAGPIEVLGGAANGPNPIELVLVSMGESLTFRTRPHVEMRANVMRDEDEPADVLLVPGGHGVSAMMEDERVRDWLVRRASTATWVTSVCAGALLLGVAGLLRGFSATTHWASLPVLALLPGVHIAPGYPRVVTSGNRMTSGGVTSAFDLAIALLAVLRGEQAAKDTELALQYDPHPTYDVGRPDRADPVTMARGARALQDVIADRIRIVDELLGPTK